MPVMENPIIYILKILQKSNHKPLLLILILLSVFASCNESTDKLSLIEEVEEELSTKLPHSFEIIKHEKGGSINGDYNEIYLMKFPKDSLKTHIASFVNNPNIYKSLNVYNYESESYKKNTIYRTYIGINIDSSTILYSISEE